MENSQPNKISKLQFTELTPDDIATHEDIYINILVGLAPHRTFGKLPTGYGSLYYEYSINEALKAKDIFQKTFK